MILLLVNFVIKLIVSLVCQILLIAGLKQSKYSIKLTTKLSERELADRSD